MKKIAITAFTTAFTLVSLLPFSTVLQAFEMRARAPLQLHTGPGVHYAKSSQIARGQNVKIGVCNPSWCHVSMGKRAGWVQTSQINPNLARANNHPVRRQTATYPVNGGMGGGTTSKGARPQASTMMTITMEIIAKDGIRGKRGQTNSLPFPVSPHRQVRTK